MQFVYTPEGAEPLSWPFNPNKLMSPECEAIEKRTGMTFAEWQQAVTKGSVLAIHALLFVLLKRTDPTLRWEAVQFCMAEVDFTLEDDEAEEVVATLRQQEATSGPLAPGEAATLATLLEQGYGAASAPVQGSEDVPVEADPKA